MPRLHAVTVALGSFAVPPAVFAGDFTIQSADTRSFTGGSECQLECDARTQGFCALACDHVTDFVSEFSNVDVVLSARLISARASVEAKTLGGPVPASATAGYGIEFSVSEPTHVYVEWRDLDVPALTDFLPDRLPLSGVWIGELAAGHHFVFDTMTVNGAGATSSGLLIRVIERVIADIHADCDADGVADWQEIVDGSQTDADEDGVPDECGTDPADLNDDGLIGALDLAILLGQWGGPGSADLDGSGHVGPSDLAIVLGSWT
ncbi:MAG: hypothetical protein SGJ11_06305 [Phycisphaerae bacterium]|nr:hypothetical protein [Phycisphaerae bacterium]